MLIYTFSLLIRPILVPLEFSIKKSRFSSTIIETAKTVENGIYCICLELGGDVSLIDGFCSENLCREPSFYGGDSRHMIRMPHNSTRITAT
jgi:hypothetical protein